MTPVTSQLVCTDKLQSFAHFLRNDCSKYTDALFVENLIDAIEKHPGADKSCIDRWLLAAFDFPKNYEQYNCIEVYNSSFYHQIMEKVN